MRSRIYSATDADTWTEYPSTSDISESDWHVLASSWHQVAFSSEVQDQPIGTTLLRVELVVYRTNDGVAYR